MNERLSKAAAALRRSVEADESTAEFQEFLEILAELGQHPETLAREDEKVFLRETAPLIRKARVPLGKVVADLERYLGNEFYGDDWFRINLRRSKAQFVRDLYSDLVDVNWDTFLDFENVDYMLKQKGDHEGPVARERVPPGAPSSHWWWWYPGNPPEVTVPSRP